MSNISPEILASKLVPETLREQEVKEALLLCNLTPLQEGIVHGLLELVMEDGIVAERVLSAGSTEILESTTLPPTEEFVELETALQLAEMKGFKRGLDAYESLNKRMER